VRVTHLHDGDCLDGEGDAAGILGHRREFNCPRAQADLERLLEERGNEDTRPNDDADARLLGRDAVDGLHLGPLAGDEDRFVRPRILVDRLRIDEHDEEDHDHRGDDRNDGIEVEGHDNVLCSVPER
jgi:hypothetical protein